MPRKKGSLNVSTVRAKAAFQEAFDELGGVPALVRWARNNKTDFYRMYARSIPTEVSGPGGGPIRASFIDAVQASAGADEAPP